MDHDPHETPNRATQSQRGCLNRLLRIRGEHPGEHLISTATPQPPYRDDLGRADKHSTLCWAQLCLGVWAKPVKKTPNPQPGLGERDLRPSLFQDRWGRKFRVYSSHTGSASFLRLTSEECEGHMHCKSSAGYPWLLY